MDKSTQDIFSQVLLAMQNNTLHVFSITVSLTILTATLAVLLLKIKTKKDRLFSSVIDNTNKIIQIIALLVGIIYGYTAINAYDINKMKEEKESLKREINRLNGDRDIGSAIIVAYSTILSNKNNELAGLSEKINNLSSIINKKENELKYINKEKRQLKSEIEVKKSELDKQYKILFTHYFLFEIYNTLSNIWIRHLNGFNSEQDMQEKMNKYMPSPYDIITETLSTIEINWFPKQKFNELKMLIYREIQNDISLHIQKITYSEYSNDYINIFSFLSDYIKLNKNGSMYVSIPENLIKIQREKQFKILTSLLDAIKKCLNKAFKLT